MFRLVPPIEKNGAILRAAQTTFGKLAILLLFGFALRFFLVKDAANMLTLLLALPTFLPQYRRFVIMGCTLFLTLQLNVLNVANKPLAVTVYGSCLLLGIALFTAARAWPTSAFGRRPVLFLLSGHCVLLIVACAIPRSDWLWNFIAVFTTYLWFIGYALLDSTAKPVRDLPLQVATFRPFWGSTNTPFPKGAAYLRRIEAKNSEELAIAQLKGLKLLVWAIILALLSRYWSKFWHSYLSLPTLAQALSATMRGSRFPRGTCWVSVFLAFIEQTLSFTIFGHRIIACCRMAGFKALRNTYRPLSSTTVLEFFNRFYYYYKELLVDFFFFPTFLRYFKQHKRLRMIAATFAAGCLGNAFFHFTRDSQLIARDGLVGALRSFQVFGFYCFVLGTALCISQVRARPAKASGFLRGKLVPIASVWTFYSLLNIFGSTERTLPLLVHLRFLGSLFYFNP